MNLLSDLFGQKIFTNTSSRLLWLCQYPPLLYLRFRKLLTLAGPVIYGLFGSLGHARLTAIISHFGFDIIIVYTTGLHPFIKIILDDGKSNSSTRKRKFLIANNVFSNSVPTDHGNHYLAQKKVQVNLFI